MKKKIISICLVIALLLSLVACNKDNSHDRVQSDLIEQYEHFNDAKFNKKLKKIEPLIEKGNKKALALYDELFAEVKRCFDCVNLSMINFDIDYTDEYWSVEYEYSNIVYNGLRNSFLTVAHNLTQSALAGDFKTHVNNESLYQFYENYVPLSDELIALQNQEDELVTEYMGLDYSSDDFYDKAELIFIDLLAIRNKLADGLGYDNYMDYMDTHKYYRDYDTEGLKTFYQAVKDMNYESLEVAIQIIRMSAVEYDVDGAQSMIDLKRAIQGISSIIDSAYDYLDTHSLYWFDNSEHNNNTGYTIPFVSTYTPFIFNNLLGVPMDLYYQAHEMGHFVNYLNCPNEIYIFRDGCYDVLEIQSQALELLCMDNIVEILNVQDSPYQFRELISCLSAVIEGCLYDEWQRAIYGDPDITAEEINDLFNQLAYEYGLNPDKEDISYEWKDVVHNFTDPGYYVSYGTSMFAALQLYETSLEDRDLAIQQYTDIVLMDAVKNGYEYAMEKANMVMFTNYASTLAILNSICSQILSGVHSIIN